MRIIASREIDANGKRTAGRTTQKRGALHLLYYGRRHKMCYFQCRGKERFLLLKTNDVRHDKQWRVSK